MDAKEIFSQALFTSALDSTRLEFLREDIERMEKTIQEKRAEIQRILDKYRPKN